jgi:hypothetical protein
MFVMGKTRKGDVTMKKAEVSDILVPESETVQTAIDAINSVLVFINTDDNTISSQLTLEYDEYEAESANLNKDDEETKKKEEVKE